MNTYSLTTERVMLRRFMIEDIDPFFQIMNELEIMRFFPNPDPPPRERVERFVQHQITHWEESSSVNNPSDNGPFFSRERMRPCFRVNDSH